MSPFSRIMAMLFDPRGRSNREDLLFAVVLLVGSAFAVSVAMPKEIQPASPFYIGLKGIVFWTSCVVLIRRLHDCGLSAWIFTGALGVVCMWSAVVALSALFIFGKSILVPTSYGHAYVLGLIIMPAIGAALWLHLQVGALHTNRFGAPSPGLWAKKPTAQTEIA